VEAAKTRLADIEQTRRTTGWERAAIVWAHTGSKTGPKSASNDANHEAVAEALGVSRATVTRARQAWKWAIENVNAPDVKPGEDVDLPTVKYPPTEDPVAHYERNLEAALKNVSSEKVAEVIRSNPDIAEAVTTAVAEVDDAAEQVQQKTYAKRIRATGVTTTTPPISTTSVPAPPYVDYDELVARAFRDLARAQQAQRDGLWAPSQRVSTLLAFIPLLFDEYAEAAKVAAAIEEAEDILSGAVSA
jgi:hypothetical protein